MKFGSLFSGIGGFDLGFERAGMSCAWQCEIDQHASKVLAHHWPEVKRYTDVRQIGLHNLEPVELICGGFPCQDLSVAGKRAGLAGGRSGLWWEFHRILSELLPRWVVIENVPGLLSSHAGRDMGLLLGALAQLGYGWAYRVLDAQYFGVAQRRRRVFIVGCLGDWQRAAQVLFEPESGRRDTAPRREKGKAIAGTLDAKSASSNRGSQANEHEFVVPVVGTLTARAGRNGAGANDEVDAGRLVPVGFIPRKTNMTACLDVVPTMHVGAGGHGGPAVAFGGNNTGGGIEVSTALNAHGSGQYDFESETFIAYNIQQNDGGEHKRGDRPNGGMYVKKTDTSLTVGTTDQTLIAWHEHRQDETIRIQGGGTSPTVSSTWGMGGGNVPYVGVRRLTPLECERLQGFPDGWTGGGQADTQRYKQLGNAVAVPVAQWIGQRIVQHG